MKTQDRQKKKLAKPKYHMADNLSGWGFVAVAVAIFIIFTLYPVISAVITSFQEYKPFGSEWVGVKNYVTAMKNDLFWKSIKNTLVYTVVVIPLSLILSFSIAVMIMPFTKKIQSLFKGIYYLPGIASGVAISVVWLWLYDATTLNQ